MFQRIGHLMDQAVIHERAALGGELRRRIRRGARHFGGRNRIGQSILGHEPVVHEARLAIEFDLVPGTGFAQQFELLPGRGRADLFRVGADTGPDGGLGGALMGDDGDLRAGGDVLQHLDGHVVGLDLAAAAGGADLYRQLAHLGEAGGAGGPGLAAVSGVLDGIPFALGHGGGDLVLLAVVHEGAALGGQRGAGIGFLVGLRVKGADLHIPVVHIADLRAELDLVPGAFPGDHVVFFAFRGGADLGRAGGSADTDGRLLEASVGNDGDLGPFGRGIGDFQRHLLVVQDHVVLAGADLDLQLARFRQAGLGVGPGLAAVGGVFQNEPIPVLQGDGQFVLRSVVQEKTALHRQGDSIGIGELSGLHIAGRIGDLREETADAHILCNCAGSQRAHHGIGVARFLIHVDHAGGLVPDVLVFRRDTVPHEQGRDQ